jgi:NADH dehydrogenase/NADH:ubiquinone oxidoreductase subunit G
LKCEITAHLETKDEIAFLQARVKELESQLLEKITNLDAIREEHLDYKRQLEFSAEEIANSDGEAQEISKEKINLEHQLAATHNPPSQQENLRNFSKLSLRSRTANKTSPSPLVPLYTKKLRYEYK